MALEDVRRKGYDEGMQVYGEYMNSFFKENPEINEVYTKWLRTKN
ncbi:hypothetical protein [Croceivirga radicis]|nr:hypothetical protein [Croceivirga radicis]